MYNFAHALDNSEGIEKEFMAMFALRVCSMAVEETEGETSNGCYRHSPVKWPKCVSTLCTQTYFLKDRSILINPF